jgi:cyclopropane fatty-acyl-phospholipid synthase-like methyltransferase
VEYITSLPKENVDRIFALDCVYHFSSRLRFLQESLRVIRDDGRIAMTDLILGDNITILQRLLMRVICFLTGSPYSNFKARKEYHNDFVQAGFEEISIEDISKHVFPGLHEFISHHNQEMARFEIGGKWTGYMVFARVLNWWWKMGVVRFVVVHARKGRL